MFATLTIWGLYNHDQALFDNLEIPDGMDKEILIDNILLECMELETIYPDPDFFKIALRTWSKKELKVWQDLLATKGYDYDPIANYDRHETHTDREERNLSGTTTNTGTTSGGGTTTNAGKVTQTDYVAGYDSEGVSVSGKTETVPEDSSTTTNTAKTDNTITSKDNGTVTHTITTTVKGNIGVTTTQQMIDEERRIVKFNLYDYITESFKRRFCLLIY